jgi:hypothetical protein
VIRIALLLCAVVSSGCVLLGAEESPCQGHADCPGAQLCVDNLCADGQRPPSCQDHVDCADDRLCADGFCELGDRPPLPCVGDGCGPGSVNLTALGSGPDTLTLQWLAPGAVGFEPGTRAARYEVYVSEQTLNEQNYEGGTLVDDALVPEVEGTEQSFTLGGLTPGQTRHFTLRAINDDGFDSVAFASATTWSASCPDGFNGQPATITNIEGDLDDFAELSSIIGCEVVYYLEFSGPIRGIPARLEFTGIRYVSGAIGIGSLSGVEELSFPDLVNAERVFFSDMADLAALRFGSMTGQLAAEDEGRGISFESGDVVPPAVLSLRDLPSLTVLEAPQLTEAEILIIENTSLADFDLSGLRRVPNALHIMNNPSLPSCAVADLLDQLESPPAVVSIANLADTDCADRLPDCLTEQIHFYESDAFNEPLLSSCFRSLSIRGAHASDELVIDGVESLEDLNIGGLSANVHTVRLPDLTEVRLGVGLRSNIINNPGLERIFLPSLTSFEGDFFLGDNPSFIQFDAPLLACISGELFLSDGNATGGVDCDPADVGLPDQVYLTCDGAQSDGICPAPPAEECVDSFTVTDSVFECVDGGVAGPCQFQQAPECVRGRVTITGNFGAASLENLAFVGEAVVVHGVSGPGVDMGDLRRVGYVGRDTPSEANDVEVLVEDNGGITSFSLASDGRVRGDVRILNNPELFLLELPGAVEGDLVIEGNSLLTPPIHAPRDLEVGGTFIVGTNDPAFPICSLDDLAAIPDYFLNPINFVSTDPNCPAP